MIQPAGVSRCLRDSQSAGPSLGSGPTQCPLLPMFVSAGCCSAACAAGLWEAREALRTRECLVQQRGHGLGGGEGRASHGLSILATEVALSRREGVWSQSVSCSSSAALQARALAERGGTLGGPTSAVWGTASFLCSEMPPLGFRLLPSVLRPHCFGAPGSVPWARRGGESCSGPQACSEH